MHTLNQIAAAFIAFVALAVLFAGHAQAAAQADVASQLSARAATAAHGVAQADHLTQRVPTCRRSCA
jgi:hypothetical protein